MKKKIIIFLSLVIIIFLAFFFLNKKGNNIRSFEDCVSGGYLVMESYPRQCIFDDKVFIEDIGNELEKLDLIKVKKPRPNEFLESPILIEGEARGFWFFEADFPVKIFDENDNLIGGAIATAQKEWMTEDFVPFLAELIFERPITKKGYIILEKDNPSGLSEYDDFLIIPINFK